MSREGVLEALWVYLASPLTRATAYGYALRVSLRVKRCLLASSLLVAPLLVALTVQRAQLGCGDAGVLPAQTQADAVVVEVSAPDGGEETDAGDDSADGSAKCIAPLVIKVELAGSFHSHDLRRLEPAVYLPGIMPVRVGGRYLAAEFSIADLCSAEEVSNSYIRLVCLGVQARTTTIEYRIESNDIVNLVDGRDRNPPEREPFKGECAKLETEIPKRDLTPLVNAYLNNNPSTRCAESKAPRRKVSAKLIRHLDADSVWHTPCSKSVCCYGSTGVRLSIPLVNVGPFQDMGKLSEQCFGPCNAWQSKKLNGFSVECFDGGGVDAYQLGDALYIVQDDRVHQVPLPCGVELDFQLRDFMATLSPGGIYFRD